MFIKIKCKAHFVSDWKGAVGTFLKYKDLNLS